MADTLESLNRAIVATPEDRTVRLVYADALDEAGDTARAEFIRLQIELETIPTLDFRHVTLSDRVKDLFDAHWLDWWRPVCKAAGLPDPHVPGKRRRTPRPPGQRRTRRARNWPYTHTAADTTIHAAGYGMAVRFAGGFPEEIRFLNLDTPENAPALVHRWGNAMPLVRLAFTHAITPNEWGSVNGPHLARLPELSFDNLPPETARVVAASPHLAGLTRLTVHPVGPDPDTLRALVTSPTWSNLRSLQFTGPLTPDAVREFAGRCRLEHLKELDLTLGNPADPFAAIGAIGAMLGQVIRAFMQAVAVPAWNEPQWAEYGPALEALATANWVRNLHRLRVGSGLRFGLGTLLRERFSEQADQDVRRLPDDAVLTLADSLNRETIERLTLPEAIVSPAARQALARWLGTRVKFE